MTCHACTATHSTPTDQHTTQNSKIVLLCHNLYLNIVRVMQMRPPLARSPRTHLLLARVFWAPTWNSWHHAAATTSLYALKAPHADSLVSCL